LQKQLAGEGRQGKAQKMTRTVREEPPIIVIQAPSDFSQEPSTSEGWRPDVNITPAFVKQFLLEAFLSVAFL
jgi:hypothetical protein